jgi:glyoxylase-like metal-dependent hydrolase (beta-lactamase superfamily II)
MATATVHCVFDHPTGTNQFLCVDNATRKAVLVDPVLDYDADSGRTSTSNIEKLVALVHDNNATVEYIFETHCHADHITGAQELRNRLGNPKLAISKGITQVQTTFKAFFNLGHLRSDGSQFDVLLNDGDEVQFGNSKITALATPGHTVDSMSLHLHTVGIFVGDTIFAPDLGTARCDFPGGDANVLLHSIQRLLSFPKDTKLYLCHDYPTGPKRDPVFATTVGETQQQNIHFQAGSDFTSLRKARDATLKVPHLIVPSVQLNVDAGRFPPAESNGVSYLKVPLNRLK